MVQAMIIALIALLIVLLIATTVVLVRKYAVTRDRGLLWLGVALVIWPLIISPLLNYGVGRAIGSCGVGECVNLFPFTLIEQGRVTMGELVAILQYVNPVVSATFGFVAVTQLYRSLYRNGKIERSRPV